MRCLAGTAQYLLNCIMRANNGFKLPIVADVYDTCTCLRHIVQEKSTSCGMDKLFIFIFISVN